MTRERLILTVAVCGALIAAPGLAEDVVFSHLEHREVDEDVACGDCHVADAQPVTLNREKCEECHDEDVPVFRAWDGPVPLRVTFPHPLHAEAMECGDCHAAPEGSSAPPATTVTSAGACFACHTEQGIEVAPSDCQTCHTEAEDLPPGPRALKFQLPHQLHAESFECKECHLGGPKPEGGHGTVVPQASRCFACHDENGVEALPPNCVACHAAKIAGTMAVPGTSVRLPHLPHATTGQCVACHGTGIGPAGSHGAVQSIPRDSCFDCHRKNGAKVSVDACAGCHGQPKRHQPPASHAGGWRKGHGDAARYQAVARHGEGCDLCHRGDGCVACHRREMPDSHNGLWRIRSHGPAASWDRDTCKTCHETGQCIRCHRTTKPMNHRGAWSAVHGLAAEVEGNERCAVCHSPGYCVSCHAGNRR